MGTCKQCGFEIVEGGRRESVRAQARGFCSAGCEDAYEYVKAKELERAAVGL